MNYCYGNTGHISKKTDIDGLEQILMHNYSVISKFNYIVIHQNCSVECETYIDDYNNVWKKIFGSDVIIIPPIKNRGHTFGSMDSDNAVVERAKKLPVDFIFKSASDILLEKEIFNIDITDEYDVYFLQGIGYTGLEPFNYNVETYLNNYLDFKYLYPQTNFYIISSKVDYINDVVEVDKAYNYCTSLSNYNGRTWEYIKDFSCEHFLKECIKRNKLRYKHLISDLSFKSLLQLININRICDCSHKNIFFEEIGVCHFHHKDDDCLSI